MTKIIFLDFDGVITHQASGWEIDNEKCLLVKKICDETGAKIVISSSWRHSTVKKTIAAYKLQDWVLTPYVVGVTPFLKLNLYCIETTDFPQRGLEIAEYIYIIDEFIKNYVILDDSTDLLYIQKDHFVKTDTYKGISEENVQQAIQILNN